MKPEERAKHCYIGDGVYVEHTPNHIILRTGDHRDSHCDNKIYLEDDVCESLFMFIEKMKSICDHQWNHRHESGFVVCDKCEKVYAEGVCGMKIEFDPIQKLAERIVCDLSRENSLSKGYELIGHLSFMIRGEMQRWCEHYWIALPRTLPIASYELSPYNLNEPKKICKKCGEIWNDN